MWYDFGKVQEPDNDVVADWPSTTEPKTERPKSPWTISHSVTRQGPGTPEPVLDDPTTTTNHLPSLPSVLAPENVETELLHPTNEPATEVPTIEVGDLTKSVQKVRMPAPILACVLTSLSRMGI